MISAGKFAATSRRVLVDEPPVGITEGGMIREGVDEQLDELRELARGGKKWIAEYQVARDRADRHSPRSRSASTRCSATTSKSPPPTSAKVPDDYIRKQTLKNQERFVTPELKEYEEKVLRAEERAIALEQRLFTELRERVSGECRRLQQTAEVLAEIDVLAGLANTGRQPALLPPRDDG